MRIGIANQHRCPEHLKIGRAQRRFVLA
jgi:hypothetical protein